MKQFAKIVLLFFAALLSGQSASPHRQIQLPSSKFLAAPAPGRIAKLNGFTPTIALSPDGRYAALLNDGYGSEANQVHQSIAILNLSTNQLVDFPDSRLPEHSHQSYFIGLAFSSDGSHLYASMGSITDPAGEKPGDTGNGIAVYTFRDGSVAPERFISIRLQKVAFKKKIAYELRRSGSDSVSPYPAGMAVIAAPGGDRLLVANNLSDNVVLLDASSGRVLQQFDLSTHEMIPVSFPYTVVASNDGRRAWCSLWNASRVAELDLEKGTVKRWIPLLEPENPIAPGSHPTALLLSPDQNWLFVTLANAGRVAVISVRENRPPYFLNTNPSNTTFEGSYPSALAVSKDGARLFVADASLNAVAVFDISVITAKVRAPVPAASHPIGFIPTDWYPTALAMAGDDLLIASSKGEGTGPNNGPPLKGPGRRQHPYIATLLYGSVSRINLHEAEEKLPGLTHQSEIANRMDSDPGHVLFKHGSNPIRHVVYILKENRTYDQVLGDLKVGNGDPSLTMYGEDITPNLHKLALQFGVFDNFYDSGEVSGNGHEWSTAAISSDYNENTWQIAYRSRERTSHGELSGEYPLERGEPDVDEPGTGYLWDNLARKGLSYRDYGEFIATIWCKPARNSEAGNDHTMPVEKSDECPRAAVVKGEDLSSPGVHSGSSASPWPWPVPMFSRSKPTRAALREHFDPRYPTFELEYPDQLRADEFLREFDGFVRARQQGSGSQLPAFILLYLPDDHTHGTTPRKPRPAASVADNDLAVGRVVEAISHSPYWDDTAIFIVEDDAQDGADHVDAHRSIAFAISKYSQGTADHPFVDSSFYTTVNMVHTVESLLGLPPMNQNDAYAPLMARVFAGEGNQHAFVADWRNRDNALIYQMNPARHRRSEESAKLDFSRPDASDSTVLNRILWHDRKGNAPMPEPKHSMFPKTQGSGDD